MLLLTQVPSSKRHAAATEGGHYLEQTAYHILHSHNQRDGFTHTEIHNYVSRVQVIRTNTLV